LADVFRGFIGRAQLCERLGITSGTLTNWLTQGLLPRPSREITRKRQWWRESVIEDWLKQLETKGR
jgi:predicted DNA-binding transcriptional regulator AlpA